MGTWHGHTLHRTLVYEMEPSKDMSSDETRLRLLQLLGGLAYNLIKLLV